MKQDKASVNEFKVAGFLVLVYDPSKDTEEAIICDSLAEANAISDIATREGNLTKIFKEVCNGTMGQ